MGHETTFTYATNGRGHNIKTTTHPDGSTRIVVTYPDGRVERTHGTAEHPVRYEYGVASPGDGLEPQVYRKRIALNRNGGDSDSDSGEWSTTFTDAHGRAWRTLRSYKDGQPAVSSTYYDKLGRTVRSVDPDGVTTLHAYFKEDDRERTIQAIDMNHNGHIDYDGTDRIAETTTELAELTPEQREQRKTSSLQNSASSSPSSSLQLPGLIRRTTTKVWDTDGDDTATRTVSITESSLDGDQSWQSANGRDASSYIERRATGPDVRTVVASRTPPRSPAQLLSRRQKKTPRSSIATEPTTPTAR